MVTFKDILVELVLGIIWIGSGIAIMFSGNTYFIIPLFVIIVVVKVWLKKKKKIAPFVAENFRKLGYEILEEKSPKFSETKFKLSFEPTLNHIPISRYRYVRQFHRIFLVKNEKDQKLKLDSIITKNWNGKIDVTFTKKETSHNGR